MRMAAERVPTASVFLAVLRDFSVRNNVKQTHVEALPVVALILERKSLDTSLRAHNRTRVLLAVLLAHLRRLTLQPFAIVGSNHTLP